jgi:hypothetical protein
MYQPYPSSGQPTGPLRPSAPAPVRTAVKLMYAGAAVSAIELIIAAGTSSAAAHIGWQLGALVLATTQRPTHYEGVTVRCSRIQSQP